jgi:hypothetical protein
MSMNKDTCDLKLNFLFSLRRHPVKLRENKALNNSAFPPTVESTAALRKTRVGNVKSARLTF